MPLNKEMLTFLLMSCQRRLASRVAGFRYRKASPCHRRYTLNASFRWHDESQKKLRVYTLCVLLLSPSAYSATPQASPLSEAEQDYYEKVLAYAMETQPDGKPYEWKTYSSSGSFTAQTAFTSKQQATCRPFAEEYTINGQKGTFSGIACKRNGSDGWCKLTTNNFLSCALETPRSPLDKIMRDSRESLERGQEKGRNMQYKSNSFIDRWWPF